MLKHILLTGLATGATIFASGGGKTPNPAPAAPNSAEIRIASELVPAGGTAQIKFSLTNPQPILSGGTRFSVLHADGVALWSPAGDAAGAAVIHDGLLYLSAISPLGDLGTNTDYPFLTITMDLPQSLAAGTVIPLTLPTDTTLLTQSGQLTVTPKPGTLTVGGDFWIHNVVPGGGTYPAGTTVRIEGSGFLPNAQLRTPHVKVSSWKVVSPTEIDFTLKEQATLDAQAIQVTSGSNTQTYYSYLRGTPLREPSRLLLRDTDPVFQLQTHALATVSSLNASVSGQYTALALQNPNPGPAVATLRLVHADDSADTATVVLESGMRIMDDIAVLLNGAAVRDGDQLNIVSTAPIQILGLLADEDGGTVKPFLPSF